MKYLTPEPNNSYKKSPTLAPYFNAAALGVTGLTTFAAGLGNSDNILGEVAAVCGLGVTVYAVKCFLHHPNHHRRPPL